MNKKKLRAKEISEKKLSREELENVKKRLDYLLMNIPVMIFICEVGGNWACTFISKNILKQLGYSPKDFTENPDFWVSKIHPDDKDRVLSDISRIYENDYHVHEYRFLRKDGEYVWMHDESRLIRDHEGEPVEVVGYWINITDKKEDEKELHRYRTHLEAIVEERTADLHSANVLLKQRISEAMKAEEMLEQLTMELNDSNRALEKELSERKLAKEELKKKSEDAQEAMHRSETYFDFLAHDIVNLISPIMSYAEIISANEDVPEVSRKYAQTIVDQCQLTASFIYNLRKIAELEKLSAKETTVVNLRDVLSEVERSIRKGYPNKKFKISYDLPSKDPMEVNWGEHIPEIILAIFDNAARYAESDEIEIGVKIKSKAIDKKHCFWQLSITDHGKGMDDGQKESLMNPFEPGRRLVRGIAMSISFASIIIKHMGGKIKIEDRVSGDHKKGTRVILLLPKAVDSG